MTGHVSIYNNNPVLLSSAFQGIVTTKRTLHRLQQCRIGHAGVDAAFSNVGTVTGYLSIYERVYLSIYDNDELATLDMALGNLVTVTGYLSIYERIT